MTKRIFIPDTLAPGSLFIKNPDIVHYLKTVLRGKLGQEVCVFNEREGQWRACIEEIAKQSITLSIQFMEKKPVRLPKLTLAFSLIKPDALHMVFEKGTELGVTHFQPLITGRSQIKTLNLEKYKKVVTFSAQQCERFCIPDMNSPIIFEAFSKKIGKNAWVATERYDKSAVVMPTLRELIAKNKGADLYLVIGPEGGWTDAERMLIHHDLQPYSLGDLVLRAETAALASLAIVRF